MELIETSDPESFVPRCGHRMTVFGTEVNGRLPIMIRRVGELDPGYWCKDCGWVLIEDEEYTQIRTIYGGSA